MRSEGRSGDLPEFERYRVVSRLRSGPISDLYRAEQTALGRFVIIKALGHGILPSSPFASALEREARLLTELDHPSIVRLLDFVREKETMWLVMEDVDGSSLEEIARVGQKLAPEAAIAIALALSDALAHAHGRGVVHRDLQPRNVWVSKEGSVKLTSFSAAADERLPTAPELLEGHDGFGTPAYMSPEQLLGEPEDPRSDLFSLGILLHEMLTGRRPFDAADERAASHRIRHDPVPPLTRLAPSLSHSLDRVVRRCLEKMPSDRFGSARELGFALRQELEDPETPPNEAIARELGRIGLSSAKAPARRDAPRMGQRRRTLSIGNALSGHLLALGLIVGGGTLIQYTSAHASGDRPTGGGARLALIPPHAGYLRVVADPWAEVVVDGEPLDTTPFARPIPLAAGVHYVRLEHPNAPVERRTVTLVESETVLLDVKMDVAHPRVPRTEPPARLNLTDPATP
jgi:serine/threonine-protein kinase